MRKSYKVGVAVLLFGLAALFAAGANAAIDNAGVLDSVLDRYSSAASAWAGVVTAAASSLFWTLVLISMVWTFGIMALRNADLGEFFAEFVRFTIFTGFFWWVLINGPNFASSIYASLRQLAGNATGLGHALAPSGIVDVGFAIFGKVVDQSSLWSPVDSAAGIVMGVAILVILALVGVNMLLLLASGWVLAYGGVFFLGFGGSRWTSDIAINYYKMVLGLAAELMAMVLLVGIGKTFLDDYYARMSVGISLKEMAVMLVVVIILLAVVNKIPARLAGIITGASLTGSIGQSGAGSVLGATGMAAAAMGAGGALVSAGAASAGGGASALMAAIAKGRENVAAGTDVMSRFSGGAAGPVDTGWTPYAGGAGYASSSSGAASRVGSQRVVRGGGQTAGRSPQAKGGDGIAPGSRASGTGHTGRQPAGPGVIASTANAAGTAGRIAADAGANLAKGTAQVARVRAEHWMDGLMAHIEQTTGGRIAAAIRGQGGGAGAGAPAAGPQPAGPTFGNDNLTAADSAPIDREAEVAAFVNRDRGNKPA